MADKNRQKVIFTVEVEVVYGDPGHLKRQIREARNTVKKAIQANGNMKITKIENKT